MPCKVKITGGKNDISLDQDIRIKVLLIQRKNMFSEIEQCGSDGDYFRKC